MHFQNILVTGEPMFLDRRRFLFKALEKHVDKFSFLPRENEWYESKFPRITIKGLLSLYTRSLSKANAVFQKNHWSFITKSKRTERKIHQLQLNSSPDLIFHIFSTYSPFWEEFSLPYVMYLDYVVALSERYWPSWVTFLNQRSRDAWYACETKLYSKALHIFVMSQVVKNSLIQDYGINSDKVTVVGVSGNFDQPYEGPKTFGTQQILFNGSDFERKGGDLVLDAFERVQAILPEAELVVIGKRISTSIPGVRNLGNITSRSELEEIFLSSDLVLAPARCEPFGLFNIEAMNYGVPCILSLQDGNGMPEFLEHEIDSILLQKQDVEELAQQIIHLLANPSRLKLLSDAARLKIRTQLNWTAVANQIAEKLADISLKRTTFEVKTIA